MSQDEFIDVKVRFKEQVWIEVKKKALDERIPPSRLAANIIEDYFNRRKNKSESA